MQEITALWSCGEKEEWYLIAYCEEANQIRTFKCERIVSTQLVEEEYSIPMEFSLEEHWKQQGQVFKQACKEEEVYPVVIRADKRTMSSLSQLEIMEMREEGDAFILKVNMFGYESA